jgi:hypothetical protein
MPPIDITQIALRIMQACPNDKAAIVSFARTYPRFFAGLVEILTGSPDWTDDEREAATRAVLDELVTRLLAQEQGALPFRVTGVPVTIAVA